MDGRFLGRLRRAHNPAIPSAHQVRRAVRERPIPPALNWLASMPAGLGAMLNDQLGDCTCAAIYHALQVWTFHTAGSMLTEPDVYVQKLYELACGYVPGNPTTDQGGVEQSVLGYCMRQGIPIAPGGSSDLNKLAAFVEIDPRQVGDVKRAVAEGGVVYLGINIPEAWCSMAVGQDWANASGPIAGGHAIIGAGYDAEWLYVVSWGSIWRMSWTAFAAVCDEAYFLADPLWINEKGTTPFGMTLADLEASMRAQKIAA